MGQSGLETVLENNKQAFTSELVQRTRFTTAFPTSMTPAQFVDKLNTNAGNVLSTSDRATAIALFGSDTDTSNTGNYNAAEMVKAFIVSTESRQRFGP